MNIRNATLADLPYIYDICAKTALDGGDARNAMSDDNKVGHYFAAPYLHFNINSCFVVCDNGLVKGYILGVANTSEYINWLNENWLKQIQPLYPNNENAVSDFDAFLNSVIHNPAQADERLNNFPGHFHIDLLPDYQNIGWGKKLIQVFSDYCKTQNTNKLHLMVSKTNKRALAFYEYLGFYNLFDVEGAKAIGLDIK